MPLALTKYPGGKSYQLKTLYDTFGLVATKCDLFVDGFAGAGSVSLNQKLFEPSQVVVNDLDPCVYQMWNCFNNDWLFQRLSKQILDTTYGEEVFEQCREIYENRTPVICYDDVSIAYATIVCHKFSRNSQCKAYGWSDRLRGGRPEYINNWENYKLKLGKLHAIARKYKVYTYDIQRIIATYNDSRVLLYLDPPYMPTTRCKNMYRTEMVIEQHEAMLDLLLCSKARIVLSGRPTELYATKLKDWNCDQKDIINQMIQKKTKVKQAECIWRNF